MIMNTAQLPTNDQLRPHRRHTPLSSSLLPPLSDATHTQHSCCTSDFGAYPPESIISRHLARLPTCRHCAGHAAAKVVSVLAHKTPFVDPHASCLAASVWVSRTARKYLPWEPPALSAAPGSKESVILGLLALSPLLASREEGPNLELPSPACPGAFV
jgi:hypothetical protein